MKYNLKKLGRKIIGLKKIQETIVSEAQFKAGDKVIDVGCGTGMLLEEIYKQYGQSLEYMGVEPEESKLHLAQQFHAGKTIKFKRGFANHLPSIQDYYTHVICMVSFHHFPREEWKECLIELKRVLAPEGKLIIVEFGKPKGILGRFLWFINPCKKISRDVESFLRSEASSLGLRLIDERSQFGYITHLIFTK
jgi:ubiquinone/menaquinone biosynthesis C-methylase UbiE